MLPPPPPPPHHQKNHLSCSESINFNGQDGNGSTAGGGPIFYDTSYQLASISDIYGVAGAGAVAAVSAALPRTQYSFSSNSTSFKSSGGGMPVSKKVLFTSAQWQEFERQTTICKYIMACVPVPPLLLLSSYNNSSPALGPVFQSSTSAVDLRFSSGMDPEPWRCRRTDGKKWRCSRDVAPDLKYCERHANKSRPRSRKPVEIQLHNSTNYSTQQPLTLLANTSSHLFQKPVAHFPTIGSVASYDQTRDIEWFAKGDDGTPPVSTCNQLWQQLMQSSSRAELNRNSSKCNKEECSFERQYEDKQEPMTLIPYVDSGSAERSESHQLNGLYCNSFLDPKAASLLENLNARTTQTTRHFIDAWSTAEKEGLDKIGKEGSVSSSMKLPVSSLTLSIHGGNDIDEDNEHANMGFRVMMSSERKRGKEVIRSHWMNPVPWMDSTPGGPLGEALCLGIAGSTKATSNLPSPHGYSNSTTTSSCNRSSFEDGSHDLTFIG